jgi:hypothetical protein
MIEGEAGELKVYMDIINFTHSDLDFFLYVVLLFVLLGIEGPRTVNSLCDDIRICTFNSSSLEMVAYVINVMCWLVYL